MKIPSKQYRCPLARVQPQTSDLDAIKQLGWRDQHILVVSESDERLDFVEREMVRRIGERLYTEGHAMALSGPLRKWLPASRKPSVPDAACRPFECQAISTLGLLLFAANGKRFLPQKICPITCPPVLQPSTGCWRRCVGHNGWRKSNDTSSGCGPSNTSGHLSLLYGCSRKLGSIHFISAKTAAI